MVLLLSASQLIISLAYLDPYVVSIDNEVARLRKDLAHEAMPASLTRDFIERLALDFVDLYNGARFTELAGRFDELTRAQLGARGLSDALRKVHDEFGSIERSAFVQQSRDVEEGAILLYWQVRFEKPGKDGRRVGRLKLMIASMGDALLLRGYGFSYTDARDSEEDAGTSGPQAVERSAPTPSPR